MKNHQETLNPTSITPASFRDLLSRYPSHLSPKVPKELETIRMVELPATLSKRVSASEDAADEDDGQGVYLTKDELARLMEWKLKHGTFRPKLLQLIKSNLESDIIKTTSAAFIMHAREKDIAKAITKLTGLAGVGVATASLVLGVLDPDGVPFFGDEVFRWICWDEPVSGGKGGKGWDRKIGYTAKEYRRYLELMEVVRKRLGVGCRDVECVGYVLGQIGAEVNSAEVEEDELVGKEVEDQAAKFKRKAEELNSQVEDKIVRVTKQKRVVEIKSPQVDASSEGTRSLRALKRRRHSD